MRVESVVFPVIRQIVKRPRLADALFRFDPWGNGFGPEADADPYAILPVIRRQGPVIHRRLFQQWFVNGYEESKQVLSSSKALASPPLDMFFTIHPYTKLDERGVSFLRNFLPMVDPPDHTRLRSLVNRAFTPRQVARLDTRMDQIIDELIDNLDGDRPDIVGGFNVPFPVLVIAELIGFPTERASWVHEMADEITKLLDPFRAFDPDVMNDRLGELHRVIIELAAERRANPRDDLLTGLAQAEEAGDRLSEMELFAVVGLLLIAGHDTTAGLLGNAELALARFPDQRAWIRNHPEAWPNAVEELIRFDTAVKSDPRAAAQDIEVGGTTIPAGANIVIMLALANRDPRRFDEPDRLILNRDNPSPLSFGHGIHYCLGANLARMEMAKALPRLLDILGDYTVDWPDVEWKPSISLRRATHIPLVVG